MHQWDIVLVRINESDRDAHPAVVISAQEDCLDPEFLRVNVLYGSKKPPATAVQPWQVLLNGADGLDFRTAGLKPATRDQIRCRQVRPEERTSHRAAVRGPTFIFSSPDISCSTRHRPYTVCSDQVYRFNRFGYPG